MGILVIIIRSVLTSEHRYCQATHIVQNMIQIQLLSCGLNKKFSCHPAFDLAPRNTLSPIDLPVLQLAVFCSLAELQTQTHHLSWVEAIASEIVVY